MGKRKITVTVDEEIVEEARRFGDPQLSTVVNNALADHVEDLARRAALKELLDTWDDEYGHVGPEDAAAAQAAFDELDGAPQGQGAA